jgi:hypothetical protein
MKKKHRNKKLKKHGRRNAAPANASSRRRSLGRGEAPDLWTTVASVAGGVGGAALGGLLVATKTLSEPEAGLLLTAGGAATAYFGDGYARVAGNSVAAAGSGQLALAYMARRADKRKVRDEKQRSDKEKAEAEKIARAVAAAQAQAALPPGPSAATNTSGLSNAANGGAYLADLFHSAANELEMLDPDEDRNAEVNVFHVEDLAA